MSVLIINDKDFSDLVKSLEVSNEPIWSKNTGRGADGTMIGDIIAHKKKLEIVFTVLDEAKTRELDAAIAPAFFSVKFQNPSTGKLESKIMYAGTPKYPVYSYVSSYPRYIGVSVNLIEQ